MMKRLNEFNLYGGLLVLLCNTGCWVTSKGYSERSDFLLAALCGLFGFTTGLIALLTNKPKSTEQ